MIIELCSWARYSGTQVYTRVLANCCGNQEGGGGGREDSGGNLQWTNVPSRGLKEVSSLPLNQMQWV